MTTTNSANYPQTKKTISHINIKRKRVENKKRGWLNG